MIVPKEIRRIIDATGMKWDDIAEPFPEVIEYTDGSRITFEWCIRRKEDYCIFYDKGSCGIYEHRPFICRTFPFALENDDLIISDCPGIGGINTIQESGQLAEDLICREYEEDEELMNVRKVLKTERIPDNKFVVIDGEGMKVMNDRD